MSHQARLTRRQFMHFVAFTGLGLTVAGCRPDWVGLPVPAQPPTATAQSREEIFYVSPQGNDAWSGLLPVPADDHTDGPFATIARARDTIQARKLATQLTGPVVVLIREGRYTLKEALVFGPLDSAPVTYAAYPGEHPIIDGGQRIDPALWHVEQLGDRRVWVAVIPEVANKQWYFKQLFVNDQRRPRARLPKVGSEPERRNFYHIVSAPSGNGGGLFDAVNSFQCKPGDIQAWTAIDDAEVVLLHYWIEERMPIASFDAATNTVTSSRFTIMSMHGDGEPDYYVENVFEALTEPGEWYLERSSGKLYYMPLPDETPESAEVFAPRLEQLLKIAGDPARSQYVQFLRFEGLTFEHTEWSRTIDGKAAFSAQASSSAPGVIALRGAQYCAFEDCVIRHTGFYALDIGDGCLGIRVVGNELYDLGAGGVKIGGAPAGGAVALYTGNNRVTDNHIYAGGCVFHSAVGVLSMHAMSNLIAHNHIHDFFYTGISCGWVWGYATNVSQNNRIEENHIHDLGHGWLSDMGGIYTLGVQPGTVLRGNVIHDVERARYGGWGIYLDEGSSQMVVENNLCYRLSSQAFHQHYGRDNTVRNNIFAFGKDSQVALSKVEDDDLSFTFERNITITDGPPIFAGGYANTAIDRHIQSDNNLFWNVSGKPVWPAGFPFNTIELWQKAGQDRHSLIGDPRFKNIKADNFSLDSASPALSLGFQPFDVSDAGPRPRDKRDL